MRRALPQSFHLNMSRTQEARQLQQVLRDRAEAEKDSAAGGVKISPVEWAPEGYAWQLNCSRWELLQREEHRDVHQFIYSENALGHLSRQELVSMVPVLMLDVQPHHNVLDMCASPGSKTRQVIEELHRREEGDGEGAETPPSGLVVANESNPARCFRLAKRVKSLGSPCVVLVNHDGADFPELYLGKNKTRPLRYDRIVCDVPCSGDGTIRKNPNVWLNWTPGIGNSLHRLQYDLVERCAELAKADGGLIAYSSCSVNPVENEAVLLRLLEACQGAVEIVDLTHKLPGLGYAPGLTHWKVFNKKMVQYDSFDDVPEKDRHMVHEGLFPPPTPSQYVEQLRKSLRLLPHHNNCGGFFVAMLRKNRPLPWEDSVSQSQEEKVGKRRKKYYFPKKEAQIPYFKKSTPIKDLWRPSSSLQYLNEDKRAALQKDAELYGMPNLLSSSSFFSGPGDKLLHWTNQAVRDVIENNRRRDLNLYHAGILAFDREKKGESDAHYCLNMHEGRGAAVVHQALLVGAMGAERAAEVSTEDFLALMRRSEECPSNNGLLIEEEMSPESREALRKLSRRPGQARLTCSVATGGEGSRIQALAFVGSTRVMLSAKPWQRRHWRLAITGKFCPADDAGDEDAKDEHEED